MSLEILYSGPKALISGPEFFNIIGTPAALAGLGRLMTELDSNTMVKGNTGLVNSYPVNLAGLKLILRAEPDGRATFREDHKALRIEAGANIFKIIGKSLTQTYGSDDVLDYSIQLADTAGANGVEPTQTLFAFTSKPAGTTAAELSKSGWFDQP